MIFVYDNWSAYDELSDNVPLTEELAMRELEEVKRLKSFGVKIDAYLMDAFWYSRDGGYREWKKDRWPNGPGRWLSACRDNGLLPGLWFPANTAFQIDPTPWKDSLSDNEWGFCCFEGPFMDGFINVLRHWYSQGVRVFKFDFADFDAAPGSLRLKMLPSEIRKSNELAYRTALAGFKKDCPEAVLCAYNGFEEAEYMTWTDRFAKRVLDPKWCSVFDSIYSGDPRPADLPQPNFWRTLDIYADQMIWYLMQGGMKLPELDNCAFMIGDCGTCYKRSNASWKTCLLLSLMRGGAVHMALGNLEHLSEEDARWYAQVQSLAEGAGPIEWLGGEPGKGEPYGYYKAQANALQVWVNPSLDTVERAIGGGWNLAYSDGWVQFQDTHLHLGPGAVVLLTKGQAPQLGKGDGFDGRLRMIESDWNIAGRSASTRFVNDTERDIHAVFRQFDSKGFCVRTTDGVRPESKSSPKLLEIRASLNGEPITVQRPDDRTIWSGMSWAYGIFEAGVGTIEIDVSSSDERVHRLAPSVYETVPGS